MRQTARECGDVPRPDIVEHLTVVVLETFAELFSAKEEWDDFVESCGSDIYFTFDWLVTWWKYYGCDRQLRCFLIRADGRLVAALPFCVQKLRVGPICVALAKFVGADSIITVLAPAFEPRLGKEIWNLVLHRLLVEERLDAVSLSPLSGASSAADAIRKVAQKSPNFQIVRDDSANPHTLVFLPGGISEYLSKLSKKTRSVNRRDARNLTKMANFHVRTLRGEDAILRFDSFVGLHQQQWEADGKLGHFGDWPSGLAFNRELVAKMAKKGRVRFHEMLSDTELLTSQYSFILGDRCYWRLPARRTHEGPEGLGRLAFVNMIEALIDEGIRVIEAGPGHYDYKLQHGGKELALRRLVLGGSSRTSRNKTRLLLLWSDLVNLLYYRFWFIKIAPYVGKRPLWRTWIMTRL